MSSAVFEQLIGSWRSNSMNRHDGATINALVDNYTTYANLYANYYQLLTDVPE